MKTTVVGNYPKIPNKPRPARLRNAINKRDRGGLTDEELETVRNEVTVEVRRESARCSRVSERLRFCFSIRSRSVSMVPPLGQTGGAHLKLRYRRRRSVKCRVWG